MSRVVLVCGGRDYSDKDTLFSVLDAEHAGHPITRLIEGGAMGADRFARIWARQNSVHVDTFAANWDVHGKAAGPIRNQRMLEEKPDVVIALPGGRGTSDMIRRANKAGVPVTKVGVVKMKGGSDEC